MNQDNHFAHEIAFSKITFLVILPGESKRHCIYRLWTLGLTYKQIQLLAGVSPNTISNVLVVPKQDVMLKNQHSKEDAQKK